MADFRQTLAASVATIQSLQTLEGPLQQAAQIVGRSLAGGHKLLVCGNGGSAADAAHLATEFVCRYQHDRRPYPAIALGDAGSTLTAIGNDYEFNEIFARQVRAFGQKGDVLIAFTTSGNSKNVLLALQAAAKLGVESIAFLGRSGGDCKGLATVELLVPSDTTARVQEAHKVLLHGMCELIEQNLPRG